MSARASPPHFRVDAAYRAGSKLQAEMSREDDQHWESVSTSAQSEAPPDTRRSRGALEQGSSAYVVIPVAGCRSKRDWRAVRSIIRRAGQRSSEERSGPRAHPASAPSRWKPQERRVGPRHCHGTQGAHCFAIHAADNFTTAAVPGRSAAQHVCGWPPPLQRQPGEMLHWRHSIVN